jgi:hypothetical protein
MLRKFVCAGFYSSQGIGAAVMTSCYERKKKVPGKKTIQGHVFFLAWHFLFLKGIDKRLNFRYNIPLATSD